MESVTGGVPLFLAHVPLLHRHVFFHVVIISILYLTGEDAFFMNRKGEGKIANGCF